MIFKACVMAMVMCRQIAIVKAPTAATEGQISCEWAVGCLLVATTKAFERTSWEVRVVLLCLSTTLYSLPWN